MYTRSKNETLFQNSKFSKEKERENIRDWENCAYKSLGNLSLSPFRKKDFYYFVAYESPLCRSLLQHRRRFPW